LANYRAYYVGFIFQSFNLIPHRTALENVELSMLFTDTPRPQRLFKAREVLINMGLEERLLHKPADLSAGEQQRVAIARALVKNPKILFADEPTGNLDRQNSEIVLNLIKNWNLEGGTVVMVTHNLDLAQKFSHRILKMNYGKFIHF
jgi:putative ABC transport system ATP-binding protein